MTVMLTSLLVRFWGWSENKREEEMDLAELRQRAQEGKPLYGSSNQPAWVQQAAASNSQWSQLSFGEYFYIVVEFPSNIDFPSSFPYVCSDPY